MSESKDWISVEEAVALLKAAGIEYNRAYFRTKFLEPGNELLPIAPQPPGARKRRRLRVFRPAVEAMIQPTLGEVG